MPNSKIHRKISKERTGKGYDGLHEWIDEHHKELGINHRVKRHAYNKEDEKYVREWWGEEGVVEWLFHIALDNLETAYKKASKVYRKNNLYNFFRFGLIPGSKFIFFSFKNMDEEELEDEFEDDYEIKD